jgi:hypothetical protein
LLRHRRSCCEPLPDRRRPLGPRRRALRVRATHATSRVEDGDDPESDHDVADRDRLVDRLGHHQLVAEEPEEIVVALGPVLHRSLDRLVDRAAGAGHLAIAGGHPLVEPDDDGIETDAQGDDPHHRHPQVHEAEREQQAVRDHDQCEPEVVVAVARDVDECQRDLDRQGGDDHPDRLDREPEQLLEAAPCDEHDQQSYATGDGDGDHAPPPYNGRS